MVLFLLVFIIFSAGTVHGRCTLDEIDFCEDQGNCTCKPCLKCPSGFGLNIECGGVDLAGTLMKCVPCKDKQTYSEENSTETCQPCPLCDGRKTLQECTTKNRSRCSANQCREGYFMNTMIDDCQPIPTARPIPTALPSTITIPSTKSNASTPRQTPSQPQADNDPSPTLKVLTKNDFGNTEKSDHPHDEHRISLKLIISLVTVAGVIFLVLITWCCISLRVAGGACTYPPADIESQDDSKQKLLKSPIPDRKELTVSWSRDFRLDKIKPGSDLHYKIAVAISSESDMKKGWREIGVELEVDDTDLQAIASLVQGLERGKTLLEKLSTSHCDLKLDEFVSVLKKVGRNDIVEIIHDDQASHTNAYISMEQNVNEITEQNKGGR